MKIKYIIVFFILVSLLVSSSMAKRRSNSEKTNSSSNTTSQDKEQMSSQDKNSQTCHCIEDLKNPETSSKKSVLPNASTTSQATTSHGHLLIIPRSKSR